MKRCQKCSRTFPDEKQKFCTFDGGLLLTEQPPPPAFDPNLTVRATSKELSLPTRGTDASEAPTSISLPDVSETISSFGSTTFQESAAGSAGKTTSSDLKFPGGAPTVVDLVASQAAAEAPPQPTPPQPAQAAAPPKKRSVLPWVLGVLIVLLLLGGGAATAGYFLVLKPWLEARNGKPVDLNANTNSAEENSNRESANTNTNSTPEPGPSIEVKEEPPAFVPPSDAEKFANLKDGLDGKLAEHYVDFSFYYPDSWKKDPKAGIAGASNFARVERILSDDAGEYAQENVAVSWYQSEGTFESDQAVFQDRAQALSDQISKGLPGYKKVSEGETKVNSLKGYEFRFQGVFRNTGKGDLAYWGRVIFLPPGKEGEKNGVTLIMFATKLASGVSGPDDVGVKGELPLILDSFRFGAER